ncbi:TPA: EF-P beta-lysylation protein EpmB [Legionella pneumophila]|jgi:EF-P beta-lysylation protein EpmB|uniref:L-lysine 2,3-aminomutase n=1 Tax=Legionella pneumophila TaxID=446 RepID=A0AAN5KSM8_LEGPN|nr:EF-P beta-lysylation protein EpmB [Legionella pneumophila]HAT1973260.1 EF-P beta-lysylation protein EpmB [Legionella pneumophila]HAT6957671.1 EF-P beta-lysylation protein EpmB [Legionella pneumophila]
MRDTSLSWQKILAQGFTSTTDLLNFLELPRSGGSLFAEKQFPSRIPRGFANRMQKRNPQDPLLLQVLAKEEELAEAEGYVIDPLSESNTLIKGLLHKYHGRVLLTLTGVCAVNCRYCFRRHFPYQANNPGRQGWKEVCDYIANDPSITEVILSGGDPLLAANLVLEELLQSLEKISHVHTLRIHTRIPIVLPERIDKGLLDLLANTRFKKVMVVHCNHPQELDESVLQACSDLKKAGCYLLNQSVLLAGVNDDAVTLSKLSHTLFDYGITPYYLHLLDKVKGSAHFDMPFLRAQSIYHQLQSLVPGYLLPRLVREEPGRSSKTLLI